MIMEALITTHFMHMEAITMTLAVSKIRPHAYAEVTDYFQAAMALITQKKTRRS